jgi:6-phosphogluconolactonase
MLLIQTLKLVLFSLLIASSQLAWSLQPMHKEYAFLVGTFTSRPAHGIAMLKYTPANNRLTINVIAPGLTDPSYVIANREQTLVFSVEDEVGPSGGMVHVFNFDKTLKQLTPHHSTSSEGAHPCYLTLDPSERFLAVANYLSGNFSLYAVEDGKLSLLQTIQHTGSSTHPYRQTQSHVHSMAFHPNGKQLIVADLGTDQLRIYDVDASRAQPLSEANQPFLNIAPGAGPRHLLFNQDGSRLYLVHELTGEVGVYAYAEGRISHMQTQSLRAPKFKKEVQAAEVRMSSDNRFLYVSNRADANNISVFEIDTDGMLTMVQQIHTGGRTPRNFNLTNDGQYLMVANQESNDIHVFKRDTETGELSKTGAKVRVNEPVYLHPLD